MKPAKENRPLQVLLAEDNPGDTLLVNEALQQHGFQYELHVIEDADKAFTFLERVGKSPDAPCPDVMLIDLNLPKASGYEVVQMFKKHPECAGALLVIMTSSDAPRDRQMAAELGAAHYFRKPSDLDAFLDLGRILKELLAGNKIPAS
ncbi:MAG: response regulator [Acidobacteriaceae bacterium]|nr:response regulator [Acidobacteriaceae bacterium]MBV8569891.1 response regulator [Acidobacteriaceae bacterium]